MSRKSSALETPKTGSPTGRKSSVRLPDASSSTIEIPSPKNQRKSIIELGQEAEAVIARQKPMYVDGKFSNGTSIFSCHAFGMKPDIFRGSVLFGPDDSFYFAVGGQIAIWDTVKQTISFQGNRDARGRTVTAMCRSSDGKAFAIAEKYLFDMDGTFSNPNVSTAQMNNHATPEVLIYHRTGELWRRLKLRGKDSRPSEIIDCCFTPDGRFFVTLSGPPDFCISYWRTEVQKVIAKVDVKEKVTHISMCPASSNSTLCVSGPGYVRFWVYTAHDKKMREGDPILELKTERGNNFVDHCWVSTTTCVAISAAGSLYVFERGDLHQVLNIHDALVEREKTEQNARGQGGKAAEDAGEASPEGSPTGESPGSRKEKEGEAEPSGEGGDSPVVLPGTLAGADSSFNPSIFGMGMQQKASPRKIRDVELRTCCSWSKGLAVGGTHGYVGVLQLSYPHEDAEFEGEGDEAGGSTKKAASGSSPAAAGAAPGAEQGAERPRLSFLAHFFVHDPSEIDDRGRLVVGGSRNVGMPSPVAGGRGVGGEGGGHFKWQLAPKEREVLQMSTNFEDMMIVQIRTLIDEEKDMLGLSPVARMSTHKARGSIGRQKAPAKQRRVELFTFPVGQADVVAADDPKAFTPVLKESFHNGKVLALDSALQRRAFATVSADRSLKVWSYPVEAAPEEESGGMQGAGLSEILDSGNAARMGEFGLITSHSFEGLQPIGIAFHPYGFEVAVAFEEYVKVMQLCADGFRQAVSINIRQPQALSYSRSGRLLAIGVFARVAILDCLRGVVEQSFGGHVAHVTKLLFSEDDRTLFSVGQEGGIYGWNLDGSMTRRFEFVDKGATINAISHHLETDTVVLSTSQGFLRAISSEGKTMLLDCKATLADAKPNFANGGKEKEGGESAAERFARAKAETEEKQKFEAVDKLESSLGAGAIEESDDGSVAEGEGDGDDTTQKEVGDRDAQQLPEKLLLQYTAIALCPPLEACFTGMNSGVIRSFNFPFVSSAPELEPAFREFGVHSSAVTQIKISLEFSLLFSADAEGSILVLSLEKISEGELVTLSQFELNVAYANYLAAPGFRAALQSALATEDEQAVAALRKKRSNLHSDTRHQVVQKRLTAALRAPGCSVSADDFHQVHQQSWQAKLDDMAELKERLESVAAEADYSIERERQAAQQREDEAENQRMQERQTYEGKIDDLLSKLTQAQQGKEREVAELNSDWERKLETTERKCELRVETQFNKYLGIADKFERSAVRHLQSLEDQEKSHQEELAAVQRQQERLLTVVKSEYDRVCELLLADGVRFEEALDQQTRECEKELKRMRNQHNQALLKESTKSTDARKLVVSQELEINKLNSRVMTEAEKFKECSDKLRDTEKKLQKLQLVAESLNAQLRDRNAVLKMKDQSLSHFQETHRHLEAFRTVLFHKIQALDAQKGPLEQQVYALRESIKDMYSEFTDEIKQRQRLERVIASDADMLQSLHSENARLQQSRRLFRKAVGILLQDVENALQALANDTPLCHALNDTLTKHKKLLAAEDQRLASRSENESLYEKEPDSRMPLVTAELFRQRDILIFKFRSSIEQQKKSEGRLNEQLSTWMNQNSQLMREINLLREEKRAHYRRAKGLETQVQLVNKFLEVNIVRNGGLDPVVLRRARTLLRHSAEELSASQAMLEELEREQEATRQQERDMSSARAQALGYGPLSNPDTSVSSLGKMGKSQSQPALGGGAKAKKKGGAASGGAGPTPFQKRKGEDPSRRNPNSQIYTVNREEKLPPARRHGSLSRLREARETAQALEALQQSNEQLEREGYRVANVGASIRQTIRSQLSSEMEQRQLREKEKERERENRGERGMHRSMMSEGVDTLAEESSLWSEGAGAATASREPPRTVLPLINPPRGTRVDVTAVDSDAAEGSERVAQTDPSSIAARGEAEGKGPKGPQDSTAAGSDGQQQPVKAESFSKELSTRLFSLHQSGQQSAEDAQRSSTLPANSVAVQEDGPSRQDEAQPSASLSANDPLEAGGVGATLAPEGSQPSLSPSDPTHAGANLSRSLQMQESVDPNGPAGGGGSEKKTGDDE